MNLIIDTHVLLWWLDDNPALTRRARAAIADGKNLAFVSAAVIWEIRIKQAVGKLVLPPNFRNVLDQQPFQSLPVTAEHAHALEDLPFHHRDPFDRILIAQARIEGFTIMTHDPVFSKYKIPLITL
jgi:PIN domain nuclease of toxin-antitoxin system